MTESELATTQAHLVATLVVGGPLPAGFDADRVDSARGALRRKRAGEMAVAWPLLAVGLGERWPALVTEWVAARPAVGSLRDGWDLARELAARDLLPDLAHQELAVREVAMRYDGEREPRPRRLPVIRVRHRLVTVGCQRWSRQFERAPRQVPRPGAVPGAGLIGTRRVTRDTTPAGHRRGGKD